MPYTKPFSERFVSHWSDGPAPRYTVPVGRRAIIKSLVAANNNASPGVIGLVVNGFQVWNATLQASSGVGIGGIMIVLYAGEQMWTEHQLTFMLSTLSGYLLEAPAASTKPAPDWAPPDRPQPLPAA